jgi:O-succinylbenzoic acid--CoA ligase
LLITDDFEWDYPTFEAYVEGMRLQVAAYPSHRIPFLATLDPLTVLVLFATWKEGKIACPLNPKIPCAEPLFQPIMPAPQKTKPYEWNLENTATHLYTSGSSGKPKVACHTLKNHMVSAQGSSVKLPLGPQNCWGLTLPLFHVGGLAILFRCCLAGARVLISKNLLKATHLSLVPTQLYRLLKEKTNLPCLQTILLGGAPLPFFETPWNVLPTYGMTEMSSQIITDNTLHPHAEMTLSQDQEIWVRGSVLFQGYLQENGAVSCPLNAAGWFETKDLGEWRNGQFHVIGRKDNLFISGGENIQPEEIEEAIRTHCSLQEVVVVPIPDEEFGSRPVVFLRDPEKLSLIQEKLLEVLSKFKIPIRAFALPEDVGLKPNRKKLRELAANFQLTSCT